MRRKFDPQMSLSHVIPRSKIGRELQEMSDILDANPEAVDLVFADLSSQGSRCDTGREGLTAEQVLRCAVLKQGHNLTYEELEFHLSDSVSLRAFCRLAEGQCPGKSALQDNIACLRETTWEAINRVVIGFAHGDGVEDARRVRIDSTVVDANIHDPTDSTLLSDGVRILTRWMLEGKELSPRPHYRFHDHRRVVKKRVLTIHTTRKPEVRVRAYRELLAYVARVRGYAAEASTVLAQWDQGSLLEIWRAQALADQIARALGILDRVVDQTTRRVLHGEKVPASEKVVSFFEHHTDIIVKDRRQVHYGHKVFVVGGQSNLILDCTIERGNPADSERFAPLLERHQRIHGRAPRQVSADGGFASKDNLATAKAQGVEDICFAKKRGLSVETMARSPWMYRTLRRFRAGIEAGISVLKRAFGLDRCTWSGWEGFQRYVWSALVAYNLMTLARIRIARA